MNNILTRRTIRKYSTKDVDNELLRDLLTKASRTQTMGNMQLYSVVVTRSEEGKKALAPAHFNQPMVTQAPVVLTICADFRRSTDWCMPLPTRCYIRRHSATWLRRLDWDCVSWERRCICRR